MLSQFDYFVSKFEKKKGKKLPLQKMKCFIKKSL